jgi:flagellar protein FlaH
MDGFEVVGKLRRDPATQNIPVVMLTSLSAQEGEKLGMDIGVAHYLTKPVDHRVLIATLRVVLRERGAAPAASSPKAAAIKTADRLISLEQRLGGGLPLDTLTLLVGAATAGKSVLCQHLVFGALESGFPTAYFSSEFSRESTVTRMNSLGMNVLGHLHSGRLTVLSLPDPKERERAEPMLDALAQTLQELPSDCEFVVVDALTGLAAPSSEGAVIGFFTSCRRICSKGKTILVSVHSHAFSADMFTRLHALSDTYISMRSESLGGKQMKTVEVRKVGGSDLEDNNMVSFEVVPNLGMRVLPISRAKA